MHGGVSSISIAQLSLHGRVLLITQIDVTTSPLKVNTKNKQAAMFGFRRSIVRIRSYTLPWRSLYGLLIILIFYGVLPVCGSICVYTHLMNLNDIC